MPYVLVDGNDPLAVYELMTEAVKKCRAGQGPILRGGAPGAALRHVRRRAHRLGGAGEQREDHGRGALNASRVFTWGYGASGIGTV